MSVCACELHSMHSIFAMERKVFVVTADVYRCDYQVSQLELANLCSYVCV